MRAEWRIVFLGVAAINAACGSESSSAADTNRAPVATINTPPHNASFSSSQLVEFVGMATDPEDGPLSAAALIWTSSASGMLGTGNAFSVRLAVGTHLVTLTATDSKGKAGTATRTINVGAPPNQLPSVSITSPVNNATFPSTESIQFSGGAFDPEDGVLVGESLTWISSMSGAIGTGGSFSRPLPPGTHVITLRAVDSRGAAGLATRTITVN